MSEKIVDLRSDTVTSPTKEMREAMARAEVGDDGYGEDPTVKRLEKLAAEITNMESAIFVPSGIMGNTCALLAHTKPGEEIILDELSHIYNWECTNYLNIAGLTVRTVQSENGIMLPERLEIVLSRPNMGYPETRLISIENTHNNSGGAAWAIDQVANISQIAKNHKLLLHMDGARLFNAAVAVGSNVCEYTKHVDSVLFCLSKGLSAPVGSVLCGNQSFIDKARKARKSLGGTMRQAGTIAAAGIVALEKQVDRLKEDHENTKLLAKALGQIKNIDLIMPEIPTNIVIIDIAKFGINLKQLVHKLNSLGILCNQRPPSRLRLVVHRHISRADVSYVIDSMKRIAKEIE